MKYTTSQSGFSLVETLVAITILLLVIIGPIKISTQTARSSSFSSEQVAAFFLAQEGVELIKKARDDRTLSFFDGNSTAPWNDFKETGGSGVLRNCFVSVNPDGCGITVSTGATGALTTPIDCDTGAPCRLYYNSSSGVVRSRFTHTITSESTLFTRIIKLTLTNSNEVKVVSEVRWRTGFLRNEQKISVESALFNVYGTQ